MITRNKQKEVALPNVGLVYAKRKAVFFSVKTRIAG